MLLSCLFQCFEEKEYQTESKRNETFGSNLFGTNMIHKTWSRSQETSEASTRVPGAPPTGVRAPTLVGPSSVNRPTSSSYIYPCTLKTSEATTKKLFPPPQLSVSTRSHLGAYSGAPPARASTTEGFYINTTPSSMSCE